MATGALTSNIYRQLGECHSGSLRPACCDGNSSSANNQAFRCIANYAESLAILPGTRHPDLMAMPLESAFAGAAKCPWLTLSDLSALSLAPR